jgi:hypothetical protein
MDENQTTPDVNELQAECKWLRKQVQIILVLLILVSATLTLFLLKQVRDVSAGVTGFRAAIDNYNKTEGAVTDDLVKKLADYGHNHPDFNAIYTKYGLDKANQAPATIPAPKK